MADFAVPYGCAKKSQLMQNDGAYWMAWLMTRRLFLFLVLILAGCTQKKDLSPPPLNPHPKEAIHIRVDFDNPEDAKRYAVTMSALYQNQQEECGYIANWWAGNFRYPYGTFDIPNESSDPTHADFTIYLDRYDREACNWEFAAPNLHVHDKYTKRMAFTDWGLDKDIVPGASFNAICQFIANEFPQQCLGRRPLADVPHYSRIPITIHVSRDSVPLRPHQPGFFSHFLEPMHPEEKAGGKLE